LWRTGRGAREGKALMGLRPNVLPRLPDSLWAATAPSAPSCPALDGEQTAELCVVGGGFTGLSTALHTAESGADVLLLEAAEPGWGAAGRNGGQVIPGLKLEPDDLERRFGIDRGQRLSAFVGSAPDLVFELIARHQIDCNERRSGWIHAIHSPSAVAKEEDRVRQWQDRGAKVEMLDRQQVATLLGTDAYVAGSLDHRGGWLQPLAFARGLARAAQLAGARLHGGSPAIRIDRHGDGWRVETPSGSVTARQVFVCTNAYTNGLWPRLSRSLIPVLSAQVATEPLSEEQRAAILPNGHAASDTRRLLRYFCIDPGGRLVFGGRGGFRETEDRSFYRHIVASLQQLFPIVRNARLEFFWCGRVAVTLDHMPHILELGPGLWAGGGYNGRGVAMATAMGRLLAACAGGEAPEKLPLPLTKPRPLPFHGLRRPAVELAVAWKRLLDAWETPRR
jgi:glycine/D-amino acid oxidase-like deaminating enzyme